MVPDGELSSFPLKSSNNHTKVQKTSELIPSLKRVIEPAESRVAQLALTGLSLVSNLIS